MSEHRFKVVLNPGDAQAWEVWGELRSHVATKGATLLILVSGITYDHRYWDFPGGPSFVEAALRQGYAVLNIDRLGLGRSGRPPASALGFHQDVHVLHQVVSAVTTGALSGLGFDRIVLVGHSNGATVSIAEAALHDDVAALVLTGNTHQVGSGALQFLDAVVDVADDPLTLEQGFPADYQTLRAGSISSLFHHPQTARASVIAVNEAIRGTFTAQQNLSLPLLLEAGLGEETISAPVLTVFGDRDVLFGDTGTEARLQAEPRLYPRSRRSTAAVIRDTGHSLALATTADLTNEVIFSWLREL